MTLSDIILNKGEIMVTQTIIEGVILDNTAYLFGIVQRANDLSDMYSIDDVVLFNAANATKFTIDNEYYYLIKENDVYSTLINTTP